MENVEDKKMVDKIDLNKNYFITGAAGFIGYHLATRLLNEGANVIGIDNLNDYYDVNLKKARLNNLKKYDNFKFILGSIEDKKIIDKTFKDNNINIIVSLAAQAGVRYSLENPYAYIDSNIMGFMNILEASRNYKVDHLVYASSSSVYGSNENMPFSTEDSVDHPVSLYAATKKSNELMAHTYSHLFDIPTTGLRFFTVYGPWGRPDMALFLFTDAIVNDKPIKVFNHGNMERDFTYVDDIVEGVYRVMNNPPKENKDYDGMNPNPSSSKAPYKVYNIGNNKPVKLMAFIETLEKKLGKEAIKEFMPLQPGDVPKTYADVSDLMKDVEFKPETTIDTGIENFVKWYKEYYKDKLQGEIND